MTHYDITMGHEVAKNVPLYITMGNDIARDIHCDITMGNYVAMCTYHGTTMHNEPILLCITTPIYDIVISPGNSLNYTLKNKKKFVVVICGDHVHCFW